jgi:type IV secretory pathway VirB10-like protein
MMNLMRAVPLTIISIFLTSGLSFGQADNPATTEVVAGSPAAIPLEVPTGTPLPVVLDKEVRIQKPGQQIHGKIAEPVYAFDKLVVPAGSEVTGSITRIPGVSATKRTIAALDANFSPPRDIEITFDHLILPDGRRLPLHTQVSPASQGVLQFASASDAKNQPKESKENAAKELAARKAIETKKEIGREWQTAKEQVAAPGKMHRLERLAIAQLPYHPQYFDAGTRFNAELLDPLNFGTEELTLEKVRMVGTAPAAGSIIHALLKTPLSSATAQKGASVEAVMTEPLITNNQLILPEGTHLKGSVLEVQPARRLHRNGQLRIVFHEIAPPESTTQHVEASLEGVEVKDEQHLTLDSEGGAQTTTPKTRYLTTGISIALAAASFAPDADAGSGGLSVGETGKSALNGASGFRVIGFVTAALVHSRVLTSAFGVYGASMSVYDHFLSRGMDVVYPKDTAMAIGFGSRVTGAPKSTPQTLLPLE